MKSNFERLDNHLRQHHLFNGNLLAAKQDEIIYLGSFGYTNDERQNKLIDGQTIFELASVSKQFTAYSTLVSFKNANESIDKDIRNYLPGFPYANITTRNLLCHTSGLPEYFHLFDQYWDKRTIATNKDVLNLLKKYKTEILFVPNENWEYSNTGYVLLAELIETISGVSFSKFLEESIFKPLDMQNSMVCNRRLKQIETNNYAYGTVLSTETNRFELPDRVADYDTVFYLDGIQGDGTVHSTVIDLLKWNYAIQNKNLLDRNLVDCMLSNTILPDNKKTDYGMGWMISHDPEFGKIVFHGGSWPGYSTYNSIYLDSGYSIISLCNQPKNLEAEKQIIEAMENILFEKPFELPLLEQK